MPWSDKIKVGNPEVDFVFSDATDVLFSDGSDFVFKEAVLLGSWSDKVVISGAWTDTNKV